MRIELEPRMNGHHRATINTAYTTVTITDGGLCIEDDTPYQDYCSIEISQEDFRDIYQFMKRNEKKLGLVP